MEQRRARPHHAGPPRSRAVLRTQATELVAQLTSLNDILICMNTGGASWRRSWAPASPGPKGFLKLT